MCSFHAGTKWFGGVRVTFWCLAPNTVTIPPTAAYCADWNLITHGRRDRKDCILHMSPEAGIITND